MLEAFSPIMIEGTFVSPKSIVGIIEVPAKYRRLSTANWK